MPQTRHENVDEFGGSEAFRCFIESLHDFTLIRGTFAPEMKLLLPKGGNRNSKDKCAESPPERQECTHSILTDLARFGGDPKGR